MDRRPYTYTEALRAARVAWPHGDDDEAGEAAAAAVDAREATEYGDDENARWEGNANE